MRWRVRFMFSQRLSASELVGLCRTLRHQLAAGLPIVRVLRQQSERGPGAVRALAGRLLVQIESGEAMGAALAREANVLPPLFIAMGPLADETGHLPEVLAELERYYLLEQQLRRRVRSQSILPIVQFVFAVLLIAGLIFILGLIAGTGKPLLTFFGLGGAAGAIAFLAAVIGTLAGVFLAWKAFRGLSRQRAAADRALLRVPVIGTCLEALAMSRLALALQLTLDSGLSIAKGLKLSLRATGNSAFAAAADDVARMLKSGQTLYEALAQARLFSVEFLAIIATAEEAGRVPEAMRQQAEYYHEEAARRLAGLARAATFGLWLLYAAFMIWMIFNIAGVYFRALGI
jgi:type IV pilus assembly protein PilC